VKTGARPIHSGYKKTPAQGYPERERQFRVAESLAKTEVENFGIAEILRKK